MWHVSGKQGRHVPSLKAQSLARAHDVRRDNHPAGRQLNPLTVSASGLYSQPIQPV